MAEVYTSERHALAAYISFCGMLDRLMYSPLSQREVDNLKQADLNFLDTDAVNEDEAARLLSEGLSLMSSTLHDKSIDDMRLQLNVDYTSSFYGIKQHGEQMAVPYESVFVDDAGLLFGTARAQVLACMREAGMQLAEGIDLPEDHLSFELQYVSMTLRQADDALKAGDAAAACQQFEMAQTFISEHILNWIDDLMKATKPLVKLDFYPGVLLAVKGLCLLLVQDLADMQREIAAGGSAKASEGQ